MSRVYSSLKEWKGAVFSTLFHRVVLSIRPRGPVSLFELGDDERMLIPGGQLNVSFASFEGRRGNGPKLARKYDLKMYDDEGRLRFGGPDSAGCKRGEQAKSAMLELLRDVNVATVPAIETAFLMPFPVVRVHDGFDIMTSDQGMAAHIWRMWKRGGIQEPSSEEDDGLLLDFSDLGVSEIVVLPEAIGKDRKLKYSFDLASPERMRKGMSNELFSRLADKTREAHLKSGLIPLDLVDHKQYEKLWPFTYWDITQYAAKSREMLDEEYEGYLVVSYDQQSALCFSTSTTVFDFHHNFFRSKHNEIERKRAEERKAARRASHAPKLTSESVAVKGDAAKARETEAEPQGVEEVVEVS